MPARVLIIGVGGLGCPAALSLARAGVRLVLCDDDDVCETNLARQILFSQEDIGRPKLEVAREVLLREGAADVELRQTRFLPDTASDLLSEVDFAVEGSDNFATKFLAADASYLAQKPVVQGAAVRWHGTVLSSRAGGRPCYRCLFERPLSSDSAPNCSEAGVMGPVVGFCGALMADLALDLAASDFSRTGHVWSFDGKKESLRKTQISARPDCGLCGPSPDIVSTDWGHYDQTACAG